MFITYDPATGLENGRFACHDSDYVETCLDRASSAQRSWQFEPLPARCSLLIRMAIILRERKKKYAKLISKEMGKPIAEAIEEIEKCAWNCDYYAENAEIFLKSENLSSDYSESAVEYEALGVVLAIMPWNYPFWQVFRLLAPALAAGNGVVLKHALNTPQCALATQEVFDLAGGPSGLYSALFMDSTSVQTLIGDDRVASVAFTGSTRVGKIVGSQAAGALKKQVLELGGSDPFIVLPGADITKAVKAAVEARFRNSGQACTSAKRFIVVNSIAEEFMELFVADVKRLVVGDPLSQETNIGPLARDDIRQHLHKQVTRSVKEGAVLRAGGNCVEGPGYFYEPTVLDAVLPSMTAFREETFGPVAATIRADDLEHAIQLANDTQFGLGASIWTRDLDLAKFAARRIEAGSVFINAPTASDPRLPFGGIKQSGYGRELGPHGIKEFTNVKTVVVS